MEVSIRFAETAEEIDRAFEARYRVLVESDGYLPPNVDRRLFDRFDAYPTTRNIIAEHDGRIIGGARFTHHSAVGTPPEEFFDFTPFLPEQPTPFGAGSQLFLEKPYRRSRIAFYLLGLGYAWGVTQGWTHVVGVLNVKIVESFVKSGYKALATESFDDRKQLAFVPVLLTMAELDREVLDFARSYRGDVLSLREEITPRVV